MCKITDLIFDTMESMDDLLGEMITAHGKKIGLDDRCPTLWISDDVVICRAGDCTKRLEYYGGFEYVTPDAKVGFGKYTLYLANEDETGRVAEVIDRAFDREIEDEDEDYAD